MGVIGSKCKTVFRAKVPEEKEEYITHATPPRHTKETHIRLEKLKSLIPFRKRTRPAPLKTDH